MFISLARRYVMSGSVTALLLVFLLVSDAHAYNPFGGGDKDSTALINARRAQGPLSTAEIAVILLADPHIVTISRKTIEIEFDPTRYQFHPELSGLLCEFAVNASCPPPSAVHGSFLVSSLPVVPELQFGTPLPNSNLSVVHDNDAGFVNVTFETEIPLEFDTPGDRNWFAFHFETLTPYNPYETMITFHDQEGSGYDFTQLSASCGLGDAIVPCGSDVPGFGVSLTPVPEPTSIAMWLAGLAGIGAWMSRSGVLRRRDGSGSRLAA